MRWRSILNQYLKSGEEKLMNAEVGKRVHRKECNNSNRPETTHKHDFCGRDYFSHISLYSHKRCCNNQTDRPTRMYSYDQIWLTAAIYTYIHIHTHIYRGFPTRMVYLYYISCLRYTILVGNPRYTYTHTHIYIYIYIYIYHGQITCNQPET